MFHLTSSIIGMYMYVQDVHMSVQARTIALASKALPRVHVLAGHSVGRAGADRLVV